MGTSTTTIFILLLITLHFLPSSSSAVVVWNSKIDGFFAFGDDLFDSGNNNGNHLSLNRADHPPYGQDFPNHLPTGRFSNGKLISDMLVDRMNLKPALSAYSDNNLKANDMATGVSFASAGAGFDDLTSTLANSISIGKQLENFKEYRTKLASSVGEAKVNETIRRSLYAISGGTNDLLLNFYIQTTRSKTYTLPQYIGFLLQNLDSLVTEIYDMGGRYFVIFGVPPIGCLPFARSTQIIPSNECDKCKNDASAAFNAQVAAFVQAKENMFRDATFVDYLHQESIMMLINNATHYGFENVKDGCCGMNGVAVGPLCKDGVKVCSDPSKYLFWDGLHLSEAAIQMLINQKGM